MKLTRKLLETLEQIIPKELDFTLIAYSKGDGPGEICDVHITGRGDPRDQLAGVRAAGQGIIDGMKQAMLKMGIPEHILGMAEEMANRHEQIMTGEEIAEALEKELNNE